MKLEEIVPWGRSFAEYKAMFSLSGKNLDGRILDRASGPSSFNAEATRRGANVTSCDPIYEFSSGEIYARIEATRKNMMRNVRENTEGFVWKAPFAATPDLYEKTRTEAMRTFIADLSGGFDEGRYVVAALPKLPFRDDAFELALCSHFLFTYSATLSEKFHVESIVEMLRVAGEVRVFPLLASSVHEDPDFGRTSPYLEPMMSELSDIGYDVRTEKVPYEFQVGGDEMLRVAK